jgi:hypothetical protein
MNIDTNFDFRTDTPPSRDIDAYSSTLRRYHKLLWSKELPNGFAFQLSDAKSKVYLHHKSKLGEFFLSSDAITNSYKHTKKISEVIDSVPSTDVDELYSKGCTVGAYLIFPSNKIENKMTINAARGTNSRIKDRFDLTLECIRRFYNNEDSPLSVVLTRYSHFFELFVDFKGYVDFFLLQDLVEDDYSSIKYFLPFNNFDNTALPCSPSEYLFYKTNSVDFIEKRNQRIMNTIAETNYSSSPNIPV